MAAKLTFQTQKSTEMINITNEVRDAVAETGIKSGLVLIYVPHSTAGITINEGADPSVKADIIETLNEIVPWERVYGHAEGNSPAHIKASIIGPSETVMLEDGQIQLGQWQSIFLSEFDGPRHRQVFIKVVSD